MNILLIDNRKYSYNAEIHIDFFSKMQKNHNIIGLGDHLDKRLNKSYKVSNKKNQISSILAKHNIRAVVSYNASSDNVGKMKWFAENLSKIDIPKFHITTDYCRRGYKEEQARWFEYVGYTHAFFRHKVSVKHPINIPKSWLPFSFDKGKYNKVAIRNINNKYKKVAFAGAAHFSARGLYRSRIAAIDYLEKNNLMMQTPMRADGSGRCRFVGDNYINFWTKNLFGLTCGGTCNFFVAKYIQIPAMHCLLVCTDTTGLEAYPKDTYIKYDVDDLGKLRSDIKYHIKHIKETEFKIKRLNNYVNKKHNNEKRSKEFIRIIKRYL